jgi:spore germination protein YaaH
MSRIPRKTRHTFLYVALFACLASLLLLYCARNKPAPPPLNRVAAWLPTSWDAARARASWEANRAHIQELSPVWYQLARSGDGSINAYGGARDAALIDEAHAHSTLVIPLVNNAYDDTGFDAQPVSAVIHDPARRAAHVAVLVNETLTCDYDGIEIDYESLNGEADREAFSVFIEELAAALHAQGKLLAIAVHPKTEEPGTWAGLQAQDWARLGAVVDRFRIMTYDYHWSGSDPGPIAPLWWMEDVLAFATSAVPPNKVYVGLHFYGHDWGDDTSSSVTWESAQQLVAAYDAIPQWQAASGWRRAVAEPWFSYVDAAGQRHEVWYADGASVEARLGLVSRYGLGGIALWRLGGEDPACWRAIADALRAGGTASPADQEQ